MVVRKRQWFFVKLCWQRIIVFKNKERTNLIACSLLAARAFVLYAVRTGTLCYSNSAWQGKYQHSILYIVSFDCLALRI